MRNTLVAIALFSVQFLFAQQAYVAHLDLRRVVDDRLKVKIDLPSVIDETIEFQLPRVVPGTYSVYDFGRFVSNFQAWDSTGTVLPSKSLIENRWQIKYAQSLAYVTYEVDDTYDATLDNAVFEPAGTSHEPDKVFVLNLFGTLGYLEGMKDHPYRVSIDHPEHMYGATALARQKVSADRDLFEAKDYYKLIDSPILYCKPDTLSFEMAGANFQFSVYSPGGGMTASFVKQTIMSTLNSQVAYLGGTLPVDRYVVLIYMSEEPTRSGGYGALEHSYSSLYVLPETSGLYLSNTIKHVFAHEFFHIVTPLNIHSEEIHQFDFMNPKMSRHLWLYEGVTEYAAHLTQVKYGSMSDDQFLEVLKSKLIESMTFNDSLPFTELSEKCLDIHKEQYYNVYQKGALIAMCLDIMLIDLSDGEYNIQSLIKDLSIRHGQDTPFKDDKLFDVIVELTYPQIGEFLSVYVAGNKAIPYNSFLERAGIDYRPTSSRKEVELGNIVFGVVENDKRLVINEVDHMNTFGKQMGYKPGDILLLFDGVEIDISNYQSEFEQFPERHLPGDRVKAVVLREDSKGRHRKVKLKAKVVARTIKTDTELSFVINPTSRQEHVRKVWLNQMN